MTKFTTLINRGHRRFIDKYVRKRNFGKCEQCGDFALLISYVDPADQEARWDLCEFCYTEVQNEEEE